MDTYTNDSVITLPEYFVWTRYGTEAGMSIEDIIADKERQRAENHDGIFLWGIGNSIRADIERLLKVTSDPKVVFTSTVSEPKIKDVSPSAIISWQSGIDINENEYQVPDGLQVTSGFEPSKLKPVHYALVCQSDNPLSISSPIETASSFSASDIFSIDPGKHLNLRQDTLVVGRNGVPTGNRYKPTLIANLAAPYFVKLTVGKSL